ncbi:MAG TPA: TfoX/Sxy family protein [Gemmatimonadales bacterium]|nr:TfoX/Sxy family protein [Gemmatimonadales bacterium]
MGTARTPPLDRVRAALARVRRVQEKRMFGGTTFMVNGKMCISVGKTRFMFRIDPEMHDDLVGKNGSRTVKMKGRAYRGFVHIDTPRLAAKKAFDFWVALALDYNKHAKASVKKR